MHYKHTLFLSHTHSHHTSYSWWQALLKGVADGQAAVVEIADELRVDGAAELRYLSVCRRDEDALHCLHQNIVKECVFQTCCEPTYTQTHTVNQHGS